MKLDMPFSEALERYIGTKPAELAANVAKAKKKRPPGEKSPSGTASPSGAVSLAARRKDKRNGR